MTIGNCEEKRLTDVIERYEKRREVEYMFAKARVEVMAHCVPAIIITKEPFFIRQEWPEDVKKALDEIDKLEETVIKTL